MTTSDPNVRWVVKPNAQASKSAFDGLSNFATNIWNDYTGKGQVMEANKNAQALAQYGYEQERQMIKEQNEYNTPKNQMLRYQEAGLNPHLIYGQGSPGNQTTIAKYNAPDVRTAPRIDYLGMTLQALQGYQAITKTMADTENVKANTDFTKVHGDFVNTQTKNLLQDIVNKKWELQKSKGLYPSQKAIQENQTQMQAQELKKLAFENLYREKGINPNDAMPYRVLSRIIDWFVSQQKGTFFNHNWKNESFKQFKR